MKYLYHATPKDNLKRIKKEGITPNSNHHWSDSKNYVYLATDPEIAYDFVVTSEYNDDFDQIAILEIPVRELNLQKLRADSNVDFEDADEIYSYEYDGVIPFSSISRIRIEDV